VETWLKQGWVDRMLIGGGYTVFTNPAQELVKLGHSHDVPVYPCINCGLQVFGSDETMRGAAANIFQAGADGLYLWNYHYRKVPMLAYGRPVPEAYGLLEDIQSASSLQFRDKRFGVDYIQHIGPYATASHPGQLPLELSRGNPGPAAAVELPVGDDLEAAGRSNRPGSVRLDLDLEGLARGERIAGRLNGGEVALKAGEPAGGDAPEGLERLGGPVQAARVRQGINRLEVWVEKGGRGRDGLRLRGVWLTVKYPPAA